MRIIYENLGRNKPEKIREPIPGYVYLVKSGDFIKVGRTTNIKGRMRALKTANPHVELVGKKWVKDSEYVERAMHEKLSIHHFSGEWFKLSTISVDTIIGYLRRIY